VRIDVDAVIKKVNFLLIVAVLEIPIKTLIGYGRWEEEEDKWANSSWIGWQ
jgi:hypothetical protein